MLGLRAVSLQNIADVQVAINASVKQRQGMANPSVRKCVLVQKIAWNMVSLLSDMQFLFFFLTFICTLLLFFPVKINNINHHHIPI